MKRPRLPLPGTLWQAMLVIAVLPVFILVSRDPWYFAVLPLLVVCGIVWGHPVVRGWAPGMMVLNLFFYAMTGGAIGIVLSMLAVVMLLAAVGSPDGLAYFDLRCPYCGSYRVRFWIRRITCADCRKGWLPRHGGVDLDAFD